MPQAPDAAGIHPVTERFAIELFLHLPRQRWGVEKSYGAWEAQSAEVRAALRDLARRFMQGDMSVAPWVPPPCG